MNCQLHSCCNCPINYLLTSFFSQVKCFLQACEPLLAATWIVTLKGRIKRRNPTEPAMGLDSTKNNSIRRSCKGRLPKLISQGQRQTAKAYLLTTVPVLPFRASRALSKEVIMHFLPGFDSANCTAACTFGSSDPGAN